MKSDYFKSLSKRTVTQTADGAGGFTESTSDSTISGFIGVLSGDELVKSQKIGVNATARLLTDETLLLTDRIVDTTGYFSTAGTVYEVVWCYVNQFDTVYYDLKQI